MTFDEARSFLTPRQQEAEEDYATFGRAAAQEEADRERAARERVDRERFLIESEIGPEVAEIAESRGHPGRPTTHDVALAEAALAYRMRYAVDQDALKAVLESDPEPVGDDFRPSRRREGGRS